MAKVGSIVVDFIANTAKLIGPTQKAKDSVKGFGDRVQGVQAKLKAFAPQLAGLTAGFLGVHSAVSKVMQSFTEMDAISKAADRLNITTERLAGLQHAAGLAGLSMADLQSALERMLQRGFSTDRLEEFADRMKSLRSDTDRMKLAYDLAGRSGAKLINLLGGGSEALREAMAEAEQLGLTFSRDVGASIEQANDALAKMAVLSKGLANTYAAELAPAITYLSNAVLYLRKQINSFGKEYGVNRVVQSIGLTGVGMLYKPIELMVDGFKKGLTNLGYFHEELKATVKTGERLPHISELLAPQTAGEMDPLRRMMRDQSWTSHAQNVARNFEQVESELAKPLSPLQTYQQQVEAINAAYHQQIVTLERRNSLLRESFQQNILATEKEKAREMADKAKRAAEERRTKLQERTRGVLDAARSFVSEQISRLEQRAALAPAAIERGSQQAFSAIMATQKEGELERQKLAIQKKMEAHLRSLERKGIILAGANL